MADKITDNPKVMSVEISVLLTTYNRAQLLRRTIMSLLSQTYKDFEILIADDGSTDNTEKVVKSFQDKRIVYEKFTHCGVYELRNKALKLCKGKYIAPCDDDDVNYPNKLEVLYKALIDTNADCTYGSWEMEGETVISKPFSIARLVGSKCILHCNTLIKREVLEEHPYPTQYDFAGDYILFLELAKARCKFVNVPEVTHLYDRTDNGISRLGSEERTLLCRFYIDKLIKELSPIEYKKYRREVQHIKFENWLIMRPKISVLMPYYKLKKQLYKTLDIIKKEGKDYNLEVIVASDGDNSLHLEIFKDLDIKFYWHPRTIYRLATARNMAMKLSSGSILIFMDAEIYPEENFFQKVLKRHYENSNLLLIHNVLDEEGKSLRNYDERPWVNMGGGSCSIRKINALKIGLYDEGYNGGYFYEDTDWGYRAYQIGIHIETDRNIKTYHQEHVSCLKYNDTEKNIKYFEKKHEVSLK